MRSKFRPSGPASLVLKVDRTARKITTDAGYRDYLIHRTGLTTHEPPYLAEGETLPLRPRTCF